MLLAQGRIEQFSGGFVFDDIDPDHDPLLADFPDVGVTVEGAEFVLQDLFAGGDLFEDRSRGEQVEGRDCGGTSKRVAGEGVAVEECATCGGWAEEGVVDFAGGQCRGEGEVTAGEPFGQTENIGSDIFLLAGEEGPCLPEADGDFIGDEEDAVLRGQFAQSGQIAWRMDEDSGCSLDNRFDDDSGDFLPVLNDGLFELLQAVFIERLAGHALR